MLQYYSSNDSSTIVGIIAAVTMYHCYHDHDHYHHHHDVHYHVLHYGD